LKGKINRKTATKYDPKYPDLYREHCAEGGSKAEFCLYHRISHDSLSNWGERYPDTMGKALKDGKKLAEGWWLSMARQHAVIDYQGPRLDTKLYTFIMGGRFGHTSDKSTLDLIKAMEQRLDALSQTQRVDSKVAPEPECDEIDDNSEAK